ncbi:MAG: hypothetical protein HOC27_05815 [Phycisphaerae bacterium]|jgi:hypothetical protein|nr:hypothetical protein [Phycisphaerae bacterium]
MFFRNNAALLCALAGSLTIHAFVIPAVYGSKPSMAHLPDTKATHLETPPIEDKSIELGIDKSKEATLTWIGYEEYEEQRARFAEVEQAAMKTEIEFATPSPIATAINAAKQLANPLAQMAADLLEAIQGIEIQIPSNEPDVVVQKIKQPKPTETPLPKSPEPVAEVVEEVIVEGTPSDRDSSATSTIKITPEQWKSGKPLAAQGIVLRPRRPSFTANQLVSNAPSDLVADLFINNKGKPANVDIVFSTGSVSIDGSLISSLYRWRASGEQIDALEDGETILISIHITFAK